MYFLFSQISYEYVKQMKTDLANFCDSDYFLKNLCHIVNMRGLVIP